MFSVSTQLLLSSARPPCSDVRFGSGDWLAHLRPEVNETRVGGLTGGHLWCCEVTSLMVGVVTTTWMCGGLNIRHFTDPFIKASAVLKLGMSRINTIV